MEKAFNQLKRKGENLTAEDEKRFDEEISKANFKIDILTERASQHYRTSLRKFEKMDECFTLRSCNYSCVIQMLRWQLMDSLFSRYF